ncbi:MAG: ABC transporter permease [Chloroflexi bacterium]|nr:ABC transporter permease [Chloroflexota bacterium]
MKRRWRADLRGVYIIWYRDVLRFWRDRPRIVAALAQPALFLFIFGSGLSASIGGAARGSFGGDYVRFLFPGVVTMAVLFTSIFSAMSIVWDREFGFLKEVLVAPVSRSAVAIGKALGGSTQAVLQGSVVLLMAPLVGVTLTPLLLVEVIPLMFLLAFALTSLGIAIASRMKSMEGFQVVMNFLMMPMFFLSGALFPLQGIPAWLQVLTRLDPASYGVDPIRRVMLAASGLPDEFARGIELLGRPLAMAEEIGILAVFAALMLGLAVRSFAAQE